MGYNLQSNHCIYTARDSASCMNIIRRAFDNVHLIEGVAPFATLPHVAKPLGTDWLTVQQGRKVKIMT